MLNVVEGATEVGANRPSLGDLAREGARRSSEPSAPPEGIEAAVARDAAWRLQAAVVPDLPRLCSMPPERVSC